ncbi:PREDICTED: processed variable antigen-like isoform X2 [Bactrocera latifrons]|uniref:processed variable antigen-like isoform X2 n=1 Tax=Bactrocera latifrons TaxID=174628 RepID=UPI0008DE92E7|nr:PREDICTED: processed variable antigen-like isoform X2 [Bactrocera latifrons]
MATKLLTLLVSTFLLLSLISRNINVIAAETETNAVDDLGSGNLDDKANVILQDPIDEEESEEDNEEADDENDSEKIENKNKDKKETRKESTEISKSEADGAKLEEAVNKKEVDNSQNKRGKNGGNRKRKRNNLKNRKRKQAIVEANLQELPLLENAQEEEKNIEAEPTTENTEDSETGSETATQELKDIKQESEGNKKEKIRGSTTKKPSARKPKARPAKSAKRSTQKFKVTGIPFPKNNKGKSANGKKRQKKKQKGRGRRRPKFGKSL